MAMGKDCAVHTHRNNVPLEIHHVHPLGMGGKDTAANRVSVCSNGHSAIHDLLDKLRKSKGKVPWLTRLRYGRKVRDLAVRAYREATNG